MQFTDVLSNLAKQTSEEDVILYSKDGIINISSKHQNIVDVSVIDLYHVKKGIKTIAEAKHQKTKFIQLVPNESSRLVEVTITLENGNVIHKKILR